MLEVACGTGVFLRLAADRGARAFGLDASHELLALARARVPEAELRAGDMQFLPYEDDSFDLVAARAPVNPRVARGQPGLRATMRAYSAS